MPTIPSCPSCGSTAVEYDSNQGNAFCVSCGTVLEENTIVAEVTFGETSSGAAVLQGQFVSADKGKTAVPSFGLGKMSTTSDFRDITIANAKRRISDLASAVRLSEHHVDMAHRWYILALQHNFTRGRKIDKIAAACLYIVCRQERTPHMLLDFSDILRINVFVLGGTFLQLVHLLNLTLPLIDPSLYINRFAARLELGTQTQQISSTALRIVSRMKRDWIVVGRRPAGVCGAALYIAARMYKFQPTVKQIVSIVRMCEATIKKRLEEYSTTATSNLSFEEFHEIWLEDEADPPAFQKSKKKEHREELFFASAIDEEGSSEVEEDIKDALKEIQSTQIMQLTPPKEFSETLSDLSTDDEMETMILSTSEAEFKEKIWTSLNAEYLTAQEEKAKATAAIASLAPGEEVDKGTKAEAKIIQRAKRKQQRKRTIGPSETPLEATKQILSIKKLSKKINYDVLDQLFE